MFSDPILKKLVKKYPKPAFQDRSEFLFEDLIESIISQQLSVKASDTIFRRFKELFGNIRHSGEAQSADTRILEEKSIDSGRARLAAKRARMTEIYFPLPEQILTMPDQTIRTAGISFQKISYIKTIAQAFTNNQINITEIKHMSDEEVIIHLTKLKGVGKWTAEMTLIFTLNRPDVFSLGDLGLRRAIENLYGITNHQEILTLTENWKPHRSTASWYLWRSLEN